MEALVLKIGDIYNKYYFDSDNSSELSLGRAFNNNIIIADPYVGKSQLKIGCSSENGYDWQIKITDHTNPVFLNGKNIEAQNVYMCSGDEITIGRTNITLYAEEHIVPATREFSFTNWLHSHKFKPYIAILMTLIMFGSAMLMSYLQTSTEPDWGDLSTAANVYLILALFWASVWSLAGRLLKGEYYFYSHLFFTSLCLSLSLLVGDPGSYVDYIFSSPTAGEIVDWIVNTLLAGLLIGFNLALVTYSPRTMSKGMVVSACMIGAIAAMFYMNQSEYDNMPAHSVSIKPSFVPTTSPADVDQYISDYDKMFNRLSTMKKEIDLEK